MTGAAWLPWALGSAACAALTAILAKVGVEGVDSDVATLFRTAVVLVALATLLLATGRLEAPAGVTVRSWVFLTLSGLATGGSWLCYFRALRLGDAARVAPVDKLSVVLVALLGVVLLGERLPARGWVGISLIGVGTVLVALA